jgi:hypothetical protein
MLKAKFLLTVEFEINACIVIEMTSECLKEKNVSVLF